MNLNELQNVILAQAPPATGAGTTTQDAPQAQLLKMLGPFVLMFVALYFVMIRPQSKKAKELAALLKSVRPGDEIVTTSGIVGVVVSVKDKTGTVSIRSSETKLEVRKSAIAEITQRAGEPAASES